KWTLLVGVPALFVLYTTLYFVYSGERLARIVVQNANQQICGRLELGSVKPSFFDPFRAHVTDLRILDPAGREIIVAKEAKATVEVLGLRHAAFVMPAIWVARGTRVLIDTDIKNGFSSTSNSCKGGHGAPPPPPSDNGSRVHFDGQLDDVAVGLRLGET